MFTELGDETFIIAAIMAMRHPRLVVYAGAMAALASMTVRSECNAPCISYLLSSNFSGPHLFMYTWCSFQQTLCTKGFCRM